MKNIIRISFFAIVIIFFGWLFYYIFTQKFPETTLSDIENIIPIKIGEFLNSANQIKQEENQKQKEGELFPIDVLLTKISNAEVFDYSVISDDEIYYFSADGRVFQAKASGDEIVSDEKKESLNTVLLSPNKKRAFVSFGNPQSPTWSIYDFLDKSWRPLQKNIKNLVWETTQDGAYGLFEENGISSIVHVSLINNSVKTNVILKNFSLQDMNIIYGDAGKILISEKPSVFYKGSLYELSLKNLEIKRLISEESGLIIKMLNNSIGLKSSSIQDVSLINSGGAVIKNLSLKTIPQKCSSLNENIYCFVFVDIPNNTSLPDDYLKNKFNSVDAIYYINTKTGDQKNIATTGEGELPAIDGTKLLITEKYLYFINRYDKTLYRLNLELLLQGKNEQNNTQ